MLQQTTENKQAEQARPPSPGKPGLEKSGLPLFFAGVSWFCIFPEVFWVFGPAAHANREQGFGQLSHGKPQGRRVGRDVRETERKRLLIFSCSIILEFNCERGINELIESVTMEGLGTWQGSSSPTTHGSSLFVCVIQRDVVCGEISEPAEMEDKAIVSNRVIDFYIITL